MSLRETPLSADPRGDYRPYIGYRADGKQQRFNLGSELQAAKVRVDRIRRLYRESVAVRQSYQLRPSWTSAALHAAMNLAQGLEQIPVPACHIVNEACGDRLQYPDYDPCWDPALPAAMIWSHAVASRLYPSIKWVFPDTTAARFALKIATSMFDAAATRQAAILHSSTRPLPVPGVLHDALDAYWSKYVKTLARSQQTLHQRRTMIDKLKRVHPNTSLSVLDLGTCESLFRYWTERPLRDDEAGRMSKKACSNHINELKNFFRWLNRTSEFSWKKPEGFSDIDTKVNSLPEDRKSILAVSKRTFTVAQLASINQACDVLDRTILYLALNCAFGAAEVGRVEFEDLFLHQKHPLEGVWQTTTAESDNWLGYMRPKTNVPGWWWLWPETVAQLDQWLAIRGKGGTSDRLLVEPSTGNPLYRDHSKNGQSGFRNRWVNLLARAEVFAPGLPALPFGTLRDQLPNWLRSQGETEQASIALAHGVPFKGDNLIEMYANRPFPLLFKSQRAYREYLRPVFVAANNT